MSSVVNNETPFTIFVYEINNILKIKIKFYHAFNLFDEIW